MNKPKGIRLCDYIEIVDENDDIFIYNVFFDSEYNYCLITEDEPLIRFLHINNCILETYYIDGSKKVKKEKIKSILVRDNWITNKDKHFRIEGNLLQYTSNMASKYGLNEEENYDKCVIKKATKKKERKLEREKKGE